MGISWLMRARARAPNALRVLYRAAPALRPVPVSFGIPDSLLHDCKCVSNRTELISKLTENGRVAELGTFNEEFANQLLERSYPIELHSHAIHCSYLSPHIAAR